MVRKIIRSIVAEHAARLVRLLHYHYNNGTLFPESDMNEVIDDCTAKILNLTDHTE